MLILVGSNRHHIHYKLIRKMQGCFAITVPQFSHKTVKCTCCSPSEGEDDLGPD